MKNVPPVNVLSVVDGTKVRAVSLAPFTKLATTVDGASAAPSVSAVPVELSVPSAISVAADTVVDGMTVVEVGPNVGYYTVLAAAQVLLGWWWNGRPLLDSLLPGMSAETRINTEGAAAPSNAGAKAGGGN